MRVYLSFCTCLHTDVHLTTSVKFTNPKHHSPSRQVVNMVKRKRRRKGYVRVDHLAKMRAKRGAHKRTKVSTSDEFQSSDFSTSESDTNQDEEEGFVPTKDDLEQTIFQFFKKTVTRQILSRQNSDQSEQTEAEADVQTVHAGVAPVQAEAEEEPLPATQNDGNMIPVVIQVCG